MKKIRIVDTNNDENALDYWKKRKPEERLSAVEFLREQFYIISGFKSIPRITRVLKMVER